MEENKQYTLKQILYRLFLSRHFLVFIMVFFPSILLLINGYIGEESFKNIVVWLMGFTLSTSTLDKYKDRIKINK